MEASRVFLTVARLGRIGRYFRELDVGGDLYIQITQAIRWRVQISEKRQTHTLVAAAPGQRVGDPRGPNRCMRESWECGPRSSSSLSGPEIHISLPPRSFLPGWGPGRLRRARHAAR